MLENLKEGTLGTRFISKKDEGSLVAQFGNNFAMTRTSGGRIHYTYRVSSPERSGILKIRAGNWALLPTKSLNPEDIKHEWRAISLYSPLLPEVFPKPIAFLQESSAILMDDVLENGVLLSERMKQKSIEPEDFYRLGVTTGKVHHAIGPLAEHIRLGQGDEATYQHMLESVFGVLDSSTSNKLMNQLSLQPRQLVLGDLQATNIGISHDGSYKFFDFERAHSGSQLFELGYLLGDLVSRTIDNPNLLKQIIPAFMEGYNETSGKQFDSEGTLLKQIALSVILYKIDNGVFESNLVTENLRSRAEALLSVDPITWDALVDLLSTDQKKYRVRRLSLNLGHFNSHESRNNVYKPQAKPLSEEQIYGTFRFITGEDLTKQLALSNLIHRNKELLANNQRVGIILDGRNGWLGDTIEASRIVSVLLETGKQVVVFTSHPDLFSNQEHAGVTTIPLEKNMISSPSYPPTTALLKFLLPYSDIPFLFPTQANWPLLVELDKNPLTGNAVIKNYEALAKQVELIFEPEIGDEHTPLRGAKDVWKRLRFHQLHALQAVSYLLGIPHTSGWKSFPKAFLSPDANSQATGGMAFNQLDLGDRIPLLIHIGTANNLELKQKKQVSINALREMHLRIAHDLSTSIRQKLKIIYFTPQEEQYKDTVGELVGHAQELGLPVHQFIPPSNWNLGAMATFLECLSREKSIVVGPDSMVASHLAPELGLKSVVIGNKVFAPYFYSPASNSLVILPKEENVSADTIDSDDIYFAIKEMLNTNGLSQ